MALYTETQLRLKAEFKNEEGVLVDPGSVTLRIEKPDRTISEVAATKTAPGVYTGLFTPNEAGIYFARWKGTIPLESALEESFYVESSRFASTAIITVDQLLAAKGEKRADLVNYAQLQRYEEAVLQASQAVRAYSDRDFGMPLVSETKTYEYEGTLIVINDCWKINQVIIKYGTFRTPVTSEYWRAEPVNGPPFTYILLPTVYGGLAPEMGFTKNLDVLVRERGWPAFIPVVEIEGEWGWPTVPADVQRATILTAIEMADVPEPYMSESIAGYNYSVAARGPAGGDNSMAGTLVPSALPARAQELLLPYVSPNI